MSKRDALRELSRRLPTPPELRSVVDSLDELSDLATAVVAVAVLESVLEKLIAKKLPVFNNALEGRLFKNRGPISDFESKILLAQALGIISEGQALRLTSVRAIRNAFAHSRTVLTFDTPQVAAEINTTLKDSAYKVYEAIMEKPAPEGISNKKIFLMIVRVALLLLDSEHEELAGHSIIGPVSTSPEE